jgi:hypothetical protein
MDPERWRRVNELFDRAIGRPPEERAALVAEASAQDPEVGRELQSLLDHHGRAGDFLQKPAHEVVPDLLVDDPGPPLGRRVGHYLVEEELGRGGMGVVYRARDTRLDRDVALKALPRELTGNEQRRLRLAQEARAAARLSHPGIARVYALEEVDAEIFLVSEFVEGRTLREEIADGVPPVPTLLSTAVQIAGAIAEAHRQGVIHRDLKPENVMRTPSGAIKILDFGLARIDSADPPASGRRLTRSGMVMGTPGYMAPEQLMGRDVDARGDIFAFGVMITELATGRLPSAGAGPGSATRTPAAGSGLPRRLEAILEKCLRSNPDERYQSASELLADLERLASGGPDLASGTGSDIGFVAADGGALWWWQTHQLIVAAVYGLLIYQAAMIQGAMPRLAGRAVFFSVLSVGVAGASMRLHLWFTSRVYPALLGKQRKRVTRWLRLADLVLGALAIAATIVLADEYPVRAGVLGGTAVAVLVAALVIEPATTHAAFRRAKVK